MNVDLEHIKTKKLIPNPAWTPGADPSITQKYIWLYEPANRLPSVGERINFMCNGHGRGGHYSVAAVVTGLNRKTLTATEAPGSYSPGTHWTVNIFKSDIRIYIELTDYPIEG